jgi:3-isopropylmalate/(R)-2-methylmalate dehydratase large subunit
MTGYTFAEKALARAAGVASARAGAILDVTPDVIFSHDNTAAIRRIFEKIGASAIRFPERVVFTLDHAVPAPTTQHAQNHAEIREWARLQNVPHFFEVGRGICHQVISEEALVLPGETIFGSDSHSTHFGWLGAFGAGVGRTEMAALWATGELWLRVPEALQITLTGRLPFGVTAKDIVLRILRDLSVDGGQYRSVEFAGDALAHLSLDERAVIPNMMAEFGAMNAYLPPDETVLAYIEARRERARTAGGGVPERRFRDYTPIYPDADAVYEQRYALDVSDLAPQIALPHQPDHVVDLTDVVGQPIEQAFLGTCTNGRLEDLQAAAAVVRGRRVRTRFIVIPASAEVMQAAAEDGTLATLVAAGAAIATPGCGPCMGNHLGVPAPNEATVSSGNRNFRGRMGTADAPIYLASPYVVAASAVCGALADPREFLRH